MTLISPYEILSGYRLGSRQATVELQRTDIPGIHIDFNVLKLVEDIKSGVQQAKAVILTGTAGDGKTYLAFRILKALGINLTAVRDAQQDGGYNRNGIFVDLDLSAGVLNESRVRILHQQLGSPTQLSLICANEGKLAELEGAFRHLNLSMPENVLWINLSQRALTEPSAWKKMLSGVLNAEFWNQVEQAIDPILEQNRKYLTDPIIAEHLRCYLLLPYLLGEPITVREMLSFLAYVLGGGLSSDQAKTLSTDAEDKRLPYLFFNTSFSEPEGYRHGDRSSPIEKLLWWLYRFDPGDHASPRIDLDLLVNLDKLDVQPPEELMVIWKKDLIVWEGEKDDSAYRQRLERFMRFARRWYALASDRGFQAYFPFHYFQEYTKALSCPSADLDDQVSTMLQGINRLLSNNQIPDYDESLKLFYLVADGSKQRYSIYLENADAMDEDEFEIKTDLEIETTRDQLSQQYLERLPRRLFLCYKPDPGIRLPVSLVLYETLKSASSPSGTFATTLWIKERDTVLRFMGAISKSSRIRKRATFRILQSGNGELKVLYNRENKKLVIS